jgi:hypothetical protein
MCSIRTAQALILFSCLILFLSAVEQTVAQGRYPYGDFGYGMPPSPWTPLWYFRAEYTAMWAEGTRLPPLLTTSPDGTDREDAGVLGEPETEVLLGGEKVADQGRQGGRITFGRWLDRQQKFALEARYWVLGEGHIGDLNSQAIDATILARPFFNTRTNDQDAQLISFPGVVTGLVRAQYRSEIHSVDVLGRYNWLEDPNGYVNVFAGYRFFRFRESAAIDELLFEALAVSDTFTSENDFHGVDLGATFGIGYDCWLLDVTTRVALGGVREQVTIRGSTVLGETVQTGGWLTAPSNIGSHTQNTFAAVPELELRFSYVALDSIRLSVGYDILLLTKASRIGQAIDTTVNPDQLAPLPLARGEGSPSTVARPGPRIDDRVLWLQGVTVGAEYRW